MASDASNHHESTVTGLVENADLRYFVRCTDAAGNTNHLDPGRTLTRSHLEKDRRILGEGSRKPRREPWEGKDSGKALHDPRHCGPWTPCPLCLARRRA